MSSKEVGIEQARKTLGDLVTAAQQGADIVLTRNGKPAARIVAIKEPAMDLTVALVNAGIDTEAMIFEGTDVAALVRTLAAA